jgi:leucyl-tRNA synthetase
VTVVVQVNGKVRANIEVPAGASQQDIEALAKEDASAKKWLAGKSIKKSFYVKDKLISFVVS